MLALKSKIASAGPASFTVARLNIPSRSWICVFGEWSGSPTPENTVASGVAVLRYMHQNLDPRQLIVYGQSLGGAIAMRAVEDLHAENPLKALVIDSSVMSYKHVGTQAMSKHWLTWILQPLAYLTLSDQMAPRPLSE